MAWSIELLAAAHRDRLLSFEERNREYFAQSIPDRGDDFFAQFDHRLQVLLEAQDAGIDLFHVILGPEGGQPIIGRINLTDVDAGGASLGYRVAEAAAGRGVATWAVGRICELAVGSYGLCTLTAEVSHGNVASRRVLERNGFRVQGSASWDGGTGVRLLRSL
ncbi:GNAT family N-acetyltransferase [Nesterenkonia sp. K-15-9-6]|uniref:GNAT family N-acetyltransferase n=1 Tax=Nesterenkonia sp. K-15-9-6 TaxID=3093918 RepID=UPI0040444CE6